MITINRSPLLALATLCLAPLMLSMPSQAHTTPAQTTPAETPKAEAPEVEAPAQSGPHRGQHRGQQGNRQGEMRDRLMAADANKDNQWSREEWLAAGRRERGFDMMDADTNGQITREELSTGMERMQAMRSQRRQN
jgi:hypothetical protein